MHCKGKGAAFERQANVKPLLEHPLRNVIGKKRITSYWEDSIAEYVKCLAPPARVQGKQKLLPNFIFGIFSLSAAQAIAHHMRRQFRHQFLLGIRHFLRHRFHGQGAKQTDQ